MMHRLRSCAPRCGGAAAPFIVATLLLAASGCGEPVSSYRLPDHDPAAAKTILVLPFLDARTLRDEKNAVNDKLATVARDLFVEVMKKNETFKNKTILTPEVDRDKTSLSLSQALDYGHRFSADLVIAGQIFSYVETRAASIPPRAGMFVRIFSVPEKRVVFVGDDYKYAGGPGAKGGRHLQAEIVASNLVKSYTATKGTPTAKAEHGGALPPTPTIVRTAPEGAPKILILPYHERANPNNLVENTGGGAVVTSLYRMELGKLGFAEFLTPATDKAGHDRLLTVEQAVALGREVGADFVLRGQVVEFRRAMSVPSFYSVLISTALLAAQLLFAESSGVDIATEIWRVEDGKCVFSHRDTSRQKYVVQAEKTVRRLAERTAPLIKYYLRKPPKELPEPIIDTITVIDRTRRDTRHTAKEPGTTEGEATTEEPEKKPTDAEEGKKPPTEESKPTPAAKPDQDQDDDDADEETETQATPEPEEAEPPADTKAEAKKEEADTDKKQEDAETKEREDIAEALRGMARTIEKLRQHQPDQEEQFKALAKKMTDAAEEIEKDANAELSAARAHLQALRKELKQAEAVGKAEPGATRTRLRDQDEDY